MQKEDTLGITVKKSQDMPEWYGQIIIKSELADYAPVKGCMVIRPYGYDIWQKIMDYFNLVLKKHDVKNAYFPIFIPESFFKKEAEHAKGFKAEVAWVQNRDESQERLALRPTSETIIYDSFAKWLRSWRDLPLKINQWCNIIRWEVSDVKLFLRSREFLWQEGHCVYETEEECDKETLSYLNEYKNLCENLLALPVLIGKKTEKEKFAGAKYTITIEAFMPDGKALQCGTSHNLGQGFAKAFEISYLGKDGQKRIPWQSSWGFSTRLIGAMAMTHSDDKGLVLPPKIAPIQIVIVPIFKVENKSEVLKSAEKVKEKLKDYSVIIDDRDGYTPGWKYNDWELKGVPVRIEIGPKDIEKEQVILVRRDTSEKSAVKIKSIADEAEKLLEKIQNSLYDKAREYLDNSVKSANSWKEFKVIVENKKIALANFCGRIECEDEIKSETGGASTRCIPFEQPSKIGKCVRCGRDGEFLVYFGRSY